ncbi:Cytochrome b/c1 [Sphingomonas antarctica]|uniref:cytochrome c1 n=1 Tax=Sphingomonas antarctica TaxID=2040274 RepID=UPI0039EA7938
MVRPIGALVGLGFVAALIFSLVGTIISAVSEPTPETAAHWVEEHRVEKHVSFSFDGPLGKYDRQQLQRGYQVYSEVCSACHSMKLVAFRDLEAIGFSPAQVKAIAKSKDVPSLNPDTGEPSTRKGLPSDYFPSPFPNDIAARAANNNAVPPDQSLLAKAREGGPHYIYELLTGYQEQPAELLKHFPDAKTPEGLHYNPYFPNLNLAMAPPLAADGQVTYAPGNPKPTVDQMAKDVAAFLMWAAEPKLEQRHRTGWAAVIFLLVGTGFAYFSYKGIWADKKAKRAAAA